MTQKSGPVMFGYQTKTCSFIVQKNVHQPPDRDERTQTPAYNICRICILKNTNACCTRKSIRINAGEVMPVKASNGQYATSKPPVNPQNPFTAFKEQAFAIARRNRLYMIAIYTQFPAIGLLPSGIQINNDPLFATKLPIKQSNSLFNKFE